MKDSSENSPAEWLRYAKSDWALAQIDPPEEVLTGMLCFHIQQAVEKALKALFCHYGLEIRKTRDIEWLLRKLEPVISIPPSIWESTRLSVYSVLSRYPADVAHIENVEYRRALIWGREVMEWVSSILE